MPGISQRVTEMNTCNYVLPGEIHDLKTLPTKASSRFSNLPVPDCEYNLSELGCSMA